MNLARVLGFLLTALFVSFPVYAIESTGFGPYEGKVLNASSKEPVSDAVVLVEWWRLNNGNSTLIDAQETLTDQNGQFSLKGTKVFNPWKRLYSEAIVTIYKSGYAYINIGTWKKWNQLLPSIPHVLNVENGKPVFGINKLATLEDRKKYSNVPVSLLLPCEKTKLMWQEINKENIFLGYSEVSGCMK